MRMQANAEREKKEDALRQQLHDAKEAAAESEKKVCSVGVGVNPEAGTEKQDLPRRLHKAMEVASGYEEKDELCDLCKHFMH